MRKGLGNPSTLDLSGSQLALSFSILLACGYLFSGCSSPASPPTIPSAALTVAESGAPVFDGVANSNNTQMSALSEALYKKRASPAFKNLIFSTAYADVACGSIATQDTCVGTTAGSRRAVYSDCDYWGETLNGTVSLVYSSLSCDFTVAGEQMNRNETITRFLPGNGSVLTDTTVAQTAYDGTLLSTGETLTNTGGGTYYLTINGIHKIRRDAGEVALYDLDFYTDESLVMSGNLSGSRTISGGEIVAFDNTNGYLATLDPNNLQYTDPTCCHPTSGSITISYTGALTATGVLTFGQSCTVATFAMNGISQPLTLLGCD